MSSGRTILLLVSVLASLAADSLGVWQLSRLFARRAWNARAMAERERPPADLTVAGFTFAGDYRRVWVAGRYDFQHEVALRGRLYRGTPGIQVVTPLRVAGRDTAILVNRGFVPTPDAGLPPTPDRYRETDSTAFDGVAMAVPDAGDGGPLPTAAGTTWHRLDLRALRAILPYPVAPYYLIVTADTNLTTDHTIRGHTLPVRVEPPTLDDGPHLSYALQWFMIGIAVLTFGLVFIRRGGAGSAVPA